MCEFIKLIYRIELACSLASLCGAYVVFVKRNVTLFVCEME